MTTEGNAYAAHDLPALRVGRARRAAEDIADRVGIDRRVAVEIAQAAVAIVGEGTRRWGHLCVDCRSLMTWEDGQSICPQHGRSWQMRAAVLLIAFDPLTEPSQATDSGTSATGSDAITTPPPSDAPVEADDTDRPGATP